MKWGGLDRGRKGGGGIMRRLTYGGGICERRFAKIGARRFLLYIGYEGKTGRVGQRQKRGGGIMWSIMCTGPVLSSFFFLLFFFFFFFGSGGGSCTFFDCLLFQYRNRGTCRLPRLPTTLL